LSHQFHPTSLREYDIRGIVGKTLGADDAHAIGRGFGTLVREAGGSKVAIGRDGRESSPVLEEALVRGLRESGADADALLCGKRARRRRRDHDHRQPQPARL
jgi:phosphomannomutase